MVFSVFWVAFTGFLVFFFNDFLMFFLWLLMVSDGFLMVKKVFWWYGFLVVWGGVFSWFFLWFKVVFWRCFNGFLAFFL